MCSGTEDVKKSPIDWKAMTSSLSKKRDRAFVEAVRAHIGYCLAVIASSVSAVARELETECRVSDVQKIEYFDRDDECWLMYCYEHYDEGPDHTIETTKLSGIANYRVRVDAEGNVLEMTYEVTDESVVGSAFFEPFQDIATLEDLNTKATNDDQ